MSQKHSHLYLLGRPFSPLYSGIMKFRESLYHKGIKRQHHLQVPVISVGNLTMGGTGKTPVVAKIAAFLLVQGLRPAIISRGYGGAAANRVNVVSNGHETFMTAEAAGDEPCLLASKLPGIPVLTGIVRILPCRHAIQELGCDVLILDDGFQHMAVYRDLDLVLFNGASLAGNSRVFPGGDLREPITALKRGHAFVLTGITEQLQERAERFATLLQERFPDKPVFYTTYQPVSASALQGDTLHDLTALPRPLYGFCGIAQPQLFQESLINQGIHLCGFTPLRDHQAFTPQLLKKINHRARMSGAQGLITTEKDLIKLRRKDFELPCFSLNMEVSSGPEFQEFIHKRINNILEKRT